MGFWSDAWDAAKLIGKGIADVFIGVVSVLVLTIFAIGYVIFSVVEHLYNWIDTTIAKTKQWFTSVIMIDPQTTEEFLKTLPDDKKKTLPMYSVGERRSLILGMDKNKVGYAQLTSTTKGFDDIIEDAFSRGEMVEQPIC